MIGTHRFNLVPLPDYESFSAVQWIGSSVVLAGQVDCPVRLVASRLASCAWWNDRENEQVSNSLTHQPAGSTVR